MAQKSKLMKFPPELRKKWASSLYQEWRFFLIVLIVLLLQIGSIIYLKDHLPIAAIESVSRLQSQYASQLLDREQIIEPEPYPMAAVPSGAPSVLEGGGRAGVPAAGGAVAAGPAGGAPGGGPGGPYADAAGAYRKQLESIKNKELQRIVRLESARNLASDFNKGN